jgi:uncharacterized protein YjbI with pentapeptide repeats
VRAVLQNADLRGADLQDADLRRANLRSAVLQDADLRRADLRDADLRRANLRSAVLQNADLRGADLRDAPLDFSSFPLWCGGSKFTADARIVRQLIAHICTLTIPDADDALKACLATMRTEAVKSHRAGGLGLLEDKE